MFPSLKYILAFLTVLSFALISLEEDLRKKLIAFHGENIDVGLFIHTDKNIYAQGERIWLKAYITGDTTLKNEVLSLRLVNANTQTVISKEFPITDLRANGDISIPDSLPDGDYKLFAYTDRMINFSPDRSFVQDIEIILPEHRALNANVSLVDDGSDKENKNINLLVKVTQRGVSLDKVNCESAVLDSNGKTLIKAQGVSNISGNVLVTLKKEYLTTAPSIRLKLNKDKLEKVLELKIPLLREYFKLSCNSENEVNLEKKLNSFLFKLTDLNDAPIQGSISVFENSARL